MFIFIMIVLLQITIVSNYPTPIVSIFLILSVKSFDLLKTVFMCPPPFIFSILMHLLLPFIFLQVLLCDLLLAFSDFSLHLIISISLPPIFSKIHLIIFSCLLLLPLFASFAFILHLISSVLLFTTSQPLFISYLHHPFSFLLLLLSFQLTY
jgi:hypothetical protein